MIQLRGLLSRQHWALFWQAKIPPVGPFDLPADCRFEHRFHAGNMEGDMAEAKGIEPPVIGHGYSPAMEHR
jgi:hypothetical protein